MLRLSLAVLRRSPVAEVVLSESRAPTTRLLVATRRFSLALPLAFSIRTVLEHVAYVMSRLSLAVLRRSPVAEVVMFDSRAPTTWLLMAMLCFLLALPLAFPVRTVREDADLLHLRLSLAVLRRSLGAEVVMSESRAPTNWFLVAS